MQTSDTVNDLATALAAAQNKMLASRKDAKNSHFNSSYSTLSSVREAAIPLLSEHGLSVVQSPRTVMVGEGQWALELETRMIHASGQWISDVLTLPLLKIDPQAVVSACTYARRASLAAFAGIAPADDDGESAVGRAPAIAAPAPPAGFDLWVTQIHAAADKGTDTLKTTWKGSSATFREYMGVHRAAEIQHLKDRAAQVDEVNQ